MFLWLQQWILGIRVNSFCFNFYHINDYYCYVLFLFELTVPQANTVVYLLNYIKYPHWLMAIGTAMLWMAYHA